MARTRRGVAVLAAAAIAAGALAAAPATGGTGLTKKRAVKIFYTKAKADARFLRQVVVNHEARTWTQGTGNTTTTNTATIEISSDGVLAIEGSVAVENGTGVPAQFLLEYSLDGGTAVEAANAYVGALDRSQLAFHDGMAVGSGTHTVAMRTAGAVSNYAYKLANLVVTFAPQGTVA